ncbi:MAG: CoA transferase, partial [Chloroflexota bacterium]
FRTLDGIVYLDAGSESLFTRLCEAIGKPEVVSDARFATYDERFRNREALEAIVAAWISERTTAEVMDALQAVVPVAPIRTVPQVIECPQLSHLGYLVELDDPKVSGLRLPGVPVQLSESPGQVRSAAPSVGQHNQEVYEGLLGYSKERLDALYRGGVI